MQIGPKGRSELARDDVRVSSHSLVVSAYPVHRDSGFGRKRAELPSEAEHMFGGVRAVRHIADVYG
jgi:hypothetical protein